MRVIAHIGVIAHTEVFAHTEAFANIGVIAQGSAKKARTKGFNFDSIYA